MYSKSIYIKNDDWETPSCYWETIQKFIPEDLTINDPFYMNGNSYYTWKLVGREIIHKNTDFFSIEKNDNKEIYISNPPYSKMLDVLKHLFYLENPFIMLIPINKLGQIKIQRLLINKNTQVIVSPIYKGFINRDGIQTKCPSQYFCFLCYKLNLDKDLLFI